MLADGDWIKVMDFGIARQVLDALATTTNTIVGTPMYGRFVVPSVLVPGLGADIDQVVRKALAPRPEDRYGSCAEFYQAAINTLDGLVTPVA